MFDSGAFSVGAGPYTFVGVPETHPMRVYDRAVGGCTPSVVAGAGTGEVVVGDDGYTYCTGRCVWSIPSNCDGHTLSLWCSIHGAMQATDRLPFHFNCTTARPPPPPPPPLLPICTEALTFGFVPVTVTPVAYEGWVDWIIADVANKNLPNAVSMRVRTSGPVQSMSVGSGGMASLVPGSSFVGSGVEITLTLVRSEDRSTAVYPSTFRLAMYDLDNDEQVQVLTGGYTASLHWNTKVIRSGNSFSGDGTDDPEPSAEAYLTMNQMARKVTFTTAATDTFQFAFMPGNDVSAIIFTMGGSVEAYTCP